jgi:hypothetical protein
MRFDEMQADGLGQLGMVPLDGAQEITGQPTSVCALLDEVQGGGATQDMMQLVCLPGQ